MLMAYSINIAAHRGVSYGRSVEVLRARAGAQGQRPPDIRQYDMGRQQERSLYAKLCRATETLSAAVPSASSGARRTLRSLRVRLKIIGNLETMHESDLHALLIISLPIIFKRTVDG